MSQEPVPVEAENAGWLRPSEQPFFRRAQDIALWTLREQNWRLTDFLSPREFQILESAVRREGCALEAYGGTGTCERVRALVMPGDWQPVPDDFEVVLVKASTVDGKMSHGAVLGSILGTGIDRRKIGDIEVADDSALVAVCEDIVPFLKNHWVSVGRHPVSLEEGQGASFHGPQYEEETVSLASMRIDALIGACCHFSRTKAKEVLAGGDVQLNFAEVSSPDESLAEGDVISVRHFGRIRILRTTGESRKGRIRLLVGVLKSKR